MAAGRGGPFDRSRARGAGPRAGGAAGALSPAEVVRRRDEVAWTALALRQNASPVLALERLVIRWFEGGAHGRA